MSALRPALAAAATPCFSGGTPVVHPVVRACRATGRLLRRPGLALAGWVGLSWVAGAALAFSPLPSSPVQLGGAAASATPGGASAGTTPGGAVSGAVGAAPAGHPALPASAVVLNITPLPITVIAPPGASTYEADEPVRQAREAYGKKDKARLAALRTALVQARHPLAAWADYWELNLRLNEARPDELEAFYARWPGSYVEDRLRADWLLELGRRREWAQIQRELPRLRMNDDREIACYGQIASLQGTRPTQAAVEAAQATWLAQRDTDDGCQLLAQVLDGAKLLPNALVWRKIHLAVEINRLRLARQTAALLGESTAKAVGEALDHAAKHVARKTTGSGHQPAELTALALAKLSASEPEDAAAALSKHWDRLLGTDLATWAWAVVARNGAQALHPQSLDWVRRAWMQGPPSASAQNRGAPPWTDETLAWHARAALRLGQGSERWQLVQRATQAMSPAERQDSAWLYWRARAQHALAPAGASGEAQRGQARQQLSQLASPLHFYGQLAAEDLGAPLALPARPTPLTPAERDAARRHVGLQRGLQMITSGLRNEGVREWNFHLMGLNERELLSAAQLACEREVWDRCINTSEKTRTEVDVAQRYPMPLRAEVSAHARNVGLDPAFVYGLIRQESRFIMDARSHVGASGLMQVMPATAKWTAKKIGLTPFSPEMIYERDTNLKIGTAYLKLVLDDQDGLPALAAAAYNAGPGRPRKWRNGPVLEPAIWAENVPFNETRDYVKKVLANTTVYAALQSGQPAALKARLGGAVGPRDPNTPPPASPQDLP